MARIGIVGAGIGGLTAAVALRQGGHDVVVFEQAAHFARVGSDINLGPNSVLTLDGLGIGEVLREKAAKPEYAVSRTWDEDKELVRVPMSSAAQEQYGAPMLTMHRADLMRSLESPLPAEVIKFAHRATGFGSDGDGVTISFESGAEEQVDVLIGADGIHSVVREALLGPEDPTFTGVVAYRSVVPIKSLGDKADVVNFIKWWGPDIDTQIVSFPLNDEDMFVFATIPQESWRDESWTQPGDVAELRASFADFPASARARLDACDEVVKSALYVRDPLPQWSIGPVTLLGDACHPMMPFMAQGAGQAIEDGIVLARCLNETKDAKDALARYERARHDRTARIQLASRDNNWMKEEDQGEWVFKYDPWTVKLP